MLLSLSGRTFLVTGGGSGIGKGAAAAIVASGGNAVLAGRNADKLAAAAEEIGGQAGDGAGEVIYEPADVTDEDEAARLVEAATAWHGRLDGVVHSAGGSETIGPITQIDSAAWRNTVDLNINGTMYVLKHAAREMVRNGGGSFIGISSSGTGNSSSGGAKSSSAICTPLPSSPEACTTASEGGDCAAERQTSASSSGCEDLRGRLRDGTEASGWKQAIFDTAGGRNESDGGPENGSLGGAARFVDGAAATSRTMASVLASWSRMNSEVSMTSSSMVIRIFFGAFSPFRGAGAGAGAGESDGSAN